MSDLQAILEEYLPRSWVTEMLEGGQAQKRLEQLLQELQVAGIRLREVLEASKNPAPGEDALAVVMQLSAEAELRWAEIRLFQEFQMAAQRSLLVRLSKIQEHLTGKPPL